MRRGGDQVCPILCDYYHQSDDELPLYKLYSRANGTRTWRRDPGLAGSRDGLHRAAYVSDGYERRESMSWVSIQQAKHHSVAPALYAMGRGVARWRPRVCQLNHHKVFQGTLYQNIMTSFVIWKIPDIEFWNIERYLISLFSMILFASSSW